MIFSVFDIFSWKWQDILREMDIKERAVLTDFYTFVFFFQHTVFDFGINIGSAIHFHIFSELAKDCLLIIFSFRCVY